MIDLKKNIKIFKKVNDSRLYKDPELDKVCNKAAEVVMDMQDKDQLNEIAWLVKEAYDKYELHETCDMKHPVTGAWVEYDPIRMVREEYRLN